MSEFLDRHMRSLFPAPLYALVLLFIMIPGAFCLYLSLNEVVYARDFPYIFIGLMHYRDILLNDLRFWGSVLRIFYFAGICVSASVVLGYGVANLLESDFTGSKICRSLMLLPMVGTPVAIGLVWKLMYEPTTGILNYFLELLHLPPALWISDSRTVIPSLALVEVWRGTPFVILILLAALQSLPRQYREAALIDGASWAQYILRIQLPLIRPHLLIALVFRLIDSLKIFDIIYVMTRGGPSQASETLNLYTYLEGFFYLETGRASALSILLFLFIIPINLALLRRRQQR